MQETLGEGAQSSIDKWRYGDIILNFTVAATLERALDHSSSTSGLQYNQVVPLVYNEICRFLSCVSGYEEFLAHVTWATRKNT